MPGGIRGSPGLLFWEWLAGAYLLGIFLVRAPAPALCAALFLGFAYAASRPPARAWAFLVLALGAGFAHAHVRLPEPPQAVPAFIENRGKAVVSGVVDEVLSKPGERLEVRLGEVSWSRRGESGTLPGRVAWTWDKAAARPAPGDHAEIENVLIKPVRGFINPGVWSYRFYRRLQGVFFRIYTRADETPVTLAGKRPGPLGRLRERFRSVLARYDAADGPGGGMPAALTMGDRYGLAPETVDLFRRASLAHSLALSGMHLGFVAALGFGLAWLAGAVAPGVFLRLPRPKLAVLAAAPLVVFYVWLGGASPSLVRSAVMFFSFGLMLMLGRGRVLVDGLFAALVLILVVSPLSAFDIRLQFSAAAVAGILVLFPIGWSALHRGVEPVRERMRGPGPAPEPGPWSRAGVFILRGAAACLLVSVCANLALMPVSVWNFGTLSLNLLPNLFWLPIMGAGVLPLSLTGMVAGSIPFLEPVGGALLGSAGMLCEWSVQVLNVASDAGFVGEAAPLRPHWALGAGYYAVLVAAPVFLRGGRVRTGSAILAAGLCLAALPGLAREFPAAERGLKIVALDTGQSQALLVETPNGFRALIDGGGTWSGGFDMGRAVIAPAAARNHPPILDLMVMTHPHLDHSRGLVFPLEHFRVGRFVHNGRLPGGEIGEEMAYAIREYGRDPETWSAGNICRIGPDMVLEVLHPPAGFSASGENDRSLALRLVWRGRGMALLPADLEGAGLRALLDSGADLSARLLVLPHHGGRSGLTSELVERARPESAVACAGYLNYRRLPHEDVRAVLQEAGVPLMVTGEVGRIVVEWNGPERPAKVETALSRSDMIF